MSSASASEYCQLCCLDVCSPSYLCGFGKSVQPDQVDLQSALLLHGQGERQVAKGIKGHRNFEAHGAHQSGLEEAVEDVYNDGVISLDVVLPRLLCYHLGRNKRTVKYIFHNVGLTHCNFFLLIHLIRPAICVLELDVGFLPDAVQILMKAIQEKGQELMRILLLVARKLGCKTADLGLEVKKKGKK